MNMRKFSIYKGMFLKEEPHFISSMQQRIIAYMSITSDVIKKASQSIIRKIQ